MSSTPVQNVNVYVLTINSMYFPYRALRYWGLPLCVLVACTAFCAMIAGFLHPINLILIYLVGVLYVALKRDLVASVTTVLGAVVIFDWIFVEPRWSLKPTDPEYFFTFAITLCVGLAVSRLAVQARDAANRERQAAVQAEAERVRNTLLAGLSHDVRTPLTTIIGVASSLLMQGEQISPAQQSVLLGNLLDQARRLQALTSDLLELARLQDGAVKPACEWCPVGELVRDGLSLCGPAVGAQRIVLDIAEEEIVWCDPRLVSQVLCNLVINASQHAPADSLITVAVARRLGSWTLSVRDQGPGLRHGEESAVFGKYQQGGTADASGGTGLGLAICDTVARLHGGNIVARTDAGAVFEMCLPCPDHPPLSAGLPE